MGYSPRGRKESDTTERLHTLGLTHSDTILRSKALVNEHII